MTYIFIRNAQAAWGMFAFEESGMAHYFYTALRWLENLSPREWLVVLAVVIVTGLICLRGFGSRSQY
jgi:hypothetical protein